MMWAKGDAWGLWFTYFKHIWQACPLCCNVKSESSKSTLCQELYGQILQTRHKHRQVEHSVSAGKYFALTSHFNTRSQRLLLPWARSLNENALATTNPSGCTWILCLLKTVALAWEHCVLVLGDEECCSSKQEAGKRRLRWIRTLTARCAEILP